MLLSSEISYNCTNLCGMVIPTTRLTCVCLHHYRSRLSTSLVTGDVVKRNLPKEPVSNSMKVILSLINARVQWHVQVVFLAGISK